MRALRVAAVVVAFGLMGVDRVDANCIRGEVTVHWSGQSSQTLWPESHCFKETGQDDSLTHTTDESEETVPTGLPNGARVGVWLPL